jgi:hypothetical protein
MALKRPITWKAGAARLERSTGKLKVTEIDELRGMWSPL